QYLGESAASQPAGTMSDAGTVARWELELNGAKTELASLEFKLAELKKQPRADLPKTLPIIVNDTRLNDLLIKLNSEKQRFAALYGDAGEKDRRVVAAVDVIKVIHRQIEGAVDGILMGMETQARAAKARVAMIEKQLEEAKSSVGRRAATDSSDSG